MLLLRFLKTSKCVNMPALSVKINREQNYQFIFTFGIERKFRNLD